MKTDEKFASLIETIEAAGQSARTYFNDAADFDEKSDGSVVTKIDTDTEVLLRDFVAEYFPYDAIVGEEGDDVSGTSGYVWYIDPIDGTENFVRKIPLFSITATRLGAGPEGSFAIVHNPISGQTFASIMEDGVYENQRLTTFREGKVGGRLAINVLSSKAEPWILPAKYNLIQALGIKYGKSSSFSAGLLEFAYVAAGRLDGVISLLSSPWDTAAGLYLAKAAGAPISLYIDGRWQRYDGAIRDLYQDLTARHLILVSTPAVHDELCAFVGDPRAWATK
ncbi:inositol monophosphatase [Candidatus Nomurabacteria bacterium]|nr:inositol monophosphatase [Candidatus Nomurabacteria bacterium]